MLPLASVRCAGKSAGIGAGEKSEPIGCSDSRPSGEALHGTTGGAEPVAARAAPCRAEDLAAYVELPLRRYEHRRKGHASFSDYVHSLDKDQLALFAEPPAEMLHR